MAKKKKTVKAHKAPTTPKAKGLQEQLKSVGSKATFESLEQTARQNFLEVRSRAFRGIDILVKQNREMFDGGFVLEVDSQGNPTRESHRKLQEQAQLLMTANFKPKSEPKPDLGWGEARWSVSTAARKAGLDPTTGFEVGFTIARRPNADRAARMCELVESSFEIDGISMIPNQDGYHLDIPAGAMLGDKGLVVVKRGAHVLELTSIMNALLKSGAKQWAKPTEAEKVAAASKAKAEAKAASDAKAAQDAFDVFGLVMADLEKERLEAERLEAERLEAERQAKLAAEWADIVTARPDLVAAWDQVREQAEERYKVIQPQVSMLLGIARPGNPSKEAVMQLSRIVPKEEFLNIASWVKESHKQRLGMSLQACTSLLVEKISEDMTLVDLWDALDWLEDGLPVEPLKPLVSYSTRKEWADTLRHPGITTEEAEELANISIKEVADSEQVST